MAEIERKFRLISVPHEIKKLPGVLIRQGYLFFDDEIELRLREKGGKHFITCKTTGNMIRKEWEVKIPLWVFSGLWVQTHSARLEKRRYTIDGPNGLKFEIDAYLGSLKGMFILEVEFPDEETARKFELPKEYNAIEVTEDDRYKNRHLAIFGVP